MKGKTGIYMPGKAKGQTAPASPAQGLDHRLKPDGQVSEGGKAAQSSPNGSPETTLPQPFPEGREKGNPRF